MPDVSTCPAVEALQRFLLGRSSEADAHDLEEHLEACDHCFRVMRTLPADDPLVQAMRTPIPGDALARPEVVQRLIERFKELRPVRPAPAGDDTVAPGSAAASPPSEETLSRTAQPGNAAVAPPRPSLDQAAASETYDFLAPAERPDEIGRLGPYRVLKVLGAGGMGVVFQAEDPDLERVVALKAMLPACVAGASAKQRFLREARTAAAIKHDHVVTIHQVGEDRGAPYLAMEFLEGETLDDCMKREGKLPLPEVLRVGREIAEGLSAAHERGLIHRDVKPANIWLEGERARVKILDFGLARPAADGAHLTQSGTIVGTPAYMAPEQARAEMVDARSDLFSLGCVLYRLSTGAMPFAGGGAMALLMALALDNPKPAHDVNPEIPTELSELIMKLLEKDPARRPASAREVVDALQTLERRLTRKQDADERTELQAAVLPAAPRPSIRRRRLVWVAAAVLALLISGGVLAEIIIHIKGPDGKEREIKAPDGSTVIVENVPDGGKGTPDDAWIKWVQSMPLLKQTEAVTAKLKELNPDFDGKLTPTYKFGELVGLELPADDLKDVSPLRALTSLKSLSLIGDLGKGRLTDLAPLKDLKQLTTLDIHGTPVSDLTPLEGLKLTSLNCESTKVADLSPLKGMPLTRLCCGDSPVADLSPLKGMPLTYLSCSHSRVSDLSPLHDLPLLTNLEAGGTPLSDLSPLKGLKLTRLLCCNNEVTDLSPLHGMPLTYLNIIQSPVSDLSPLKGMPLQSLECVTTPVSDLTPLKDTPLTFLNASHCGISDLSPLKDMKVLNLSCQGCKVTDLSPLQGTPIDTLNCDFKPERDAEILRSIKTLETINGKPAAEVLKETDAKQPAKAP